LIDWLIDTLTDWLINEWLIHWLIEKYLHSSKPQTLGKLFNTFAIQQHLIFYIITTSRIKVNKQTLWAYVRNKQTILYNSVLLFSSITDIYAKLTFELGYFEFNYKPFIIRAYFNFKMFVSHFFKIIQFILIVSHTCTLCGPIFIFNWCHSVYKR